MQIFLEQESAIIGSGNDVSPELAARDVTYIWFRRYNWECISHRRNEEKNQIRQNSIRLYFWRIWISSKWVCVIIYCLLSPSFEFFFFPLTISKNSVNLLNLLNSMQCSNEICVDILLKYLGFVSFREYSSRRRKWSVLIPKNILLQYYQKFIF